MNRVVKFYAGFTPRDWGFGIEFNWGGGDICAPSFDVLIGPWTFSVSDNGAEKEDWLAVANERMVGGASYHDE